MTEIKFNITTRQTLGAHQRLKSRKIIQSLFESRTSFTRFPFRILYGNTTRSGPLQAGFTVSAKQFKKAVQRNRIKRLMREAWRTEKTGLDAELTAQNKCMAVFIIYTGKEMPEWDLIRENMQKVVEQLFSILPELPETIR